MTIHRIQRPAFYHSYCRWISIVLISVLISCVTSNLSSADTTHEASWEDCETFLAPSSLPLGGWGVYAGRDFQADEIVEITPRFFALPHGDLTVDTTVLQDYVYGYDRWDDEIKDFATLHCVVFGNTMFYNHHTEPNIAWSAFGREPTEDEPDVGIVTGFLARRDIAAGEELFSSYGLEDGGTLWFQERKLELKLVPPYESQKNGTVYEEDKKKYCSKIHSGIGQPTWKSHIEDEVDLNTILFQDSRLPPRDHPTAVAKTMVKTGDILEISPALVLDQTKVTRESNLLAPSCFFWDDWDATQQQSLIDLHKSGDLRLQHQADDTAWIRTDALIGNYQDLVIFPVAGNIGLINRVGRSSSEQGNEEGNDEQANCEIRIISSGSLKSHLDHGGSNGSAGILLQVIAIKDIAMGEELKLNIPRVMSKPANSLFLEELITSGQIIPKYLAAFLHDLYSGHDEL
jgi:SET domain